MAIAVEKTKNGLYFATITNTPNERIATKVLENYTKRKNITLTSIVYANR